MHHPRAFVCLILPPKTLALIDEPTSSELMQADPAFSGNEWRLGAFLQSKSAGKP